MSGGDNICKFERSCSNDTSYDTSSVKILFNTEITKKAKHRKCLIGTGIAVICFVFLLLCVILLSSKPDRHIEVLTGNNTNGKRNSSSAQTISNETTNNTEGKKHLSRNRKIS